MAPGFRLSNCKSCKAQIVWTELQGGKKMPLSYKTKEEKRQQDMFGKRGELLGFSFEPHWADCPNAQSHKTAKPAKDNNAPAEPD